MNFVDYNNGVLNDTIDLSIFGKGILITESDDIIRLNKEVIVKSKESNVRSCDSCGLKDLKELCECMNCYVKDQDYKIKYRRLW